MPVSTPIAAPLVQPAPTDLTGQMGLLDMGGTLQQANSVRYEGIPGFNTGLFGQSWVSMAAEQKTSMPAPPSIASAPAPNQPVIYCEMMAEKTGVNKVEIINNEVIAAGKNKLDGTMALIHCRVTGQALEFTIKTPAQDKTAALMEEITTRFK